MKQSTAPKVFFSLIAVFSIAVLMPACDTNKKNRSQTLDEISNAEAQHARMKDQLNQLSNINNQLKAEIGQLSIEVNQRTKRHSDLKDSLANYLLEHKLVTAAILAMGGAAAGVVDNNTDQETKDVLTGVGVIGLGVCLFNASECADVTSRIIYFGSEMESETKAINFANTHLANKTSSLRVTEKEFSNLSHQASTKAGEMIALREKHDSMLCTFCF